MPADRGGEHVAAHLVADDHRHIARRSISPTVDRGQSALALNDVVEGGAVALRPVFAIAARPGIDDARIDGGDRSVIDAEPFGVTGPHIVHEDIGGPPQGREGGPRGWALPAEGEAPLVLVRAWGKSPPAPGSPA